MVYVYDIESYPNIFTFTFRPVKKGREIIVFEVSDRKDDRKELLKFLRQKDLTLVGFNNYYFDYPILHHLLENPRISIQMLYRFIQEKIMTSRYALVPEWKIKIPQIDLYKINHYDNANRMTSLKWLEFMLRWHKVQDLPFPIGRDVPYHLFDELIEYNINDVDFTYHFLGKCMDAILFRQDMSKILNKNVMNYSDVKIGEYLNQITYSRLSGRQFSDFRELRTHRGRIHIKDIVPDYIEFKTSYMKEFLEDIKKDSFFIDDDDWHKIIEIDGFEMKVAKGGLHSKDTPRIIQCEEGFTMKEKDVGSMAQLKLDELLETLRGQSAAKPTE